MKLIKPLFLITVLSTTFAQAGYIKNTCEAYRVSKDTNENVQKVRIQDNTVSIHKTPFLELKKGQLMDLGPKSPLSAVAEAVDGKADYLVEVSVLSQITHAYGRAIVGRGHDFDSYKVKIVASRNGKSHTFEGLCTTEILTSCGGECADESNNRDEL